MNQNNIKMNKIYFLIIAALFFLPRNDKNNTWSFESEFYAPKNSVRIYTDDINGDWFIFKTLRPITIDSIEYLHFLIEPKEKYFNLDIQDYLIFIKDNKVFRFNSKNYKKPIFMFDFNQQVNHKVVVPTISNYNYMENDTIILESIYYSKQFKDSIYNLKVIPQKVIYSSGTLDPTCSQIEISKKVGLISFNVIYHLGEKKFKLYNGGFRLKKNWEKRIKFIPCE